ncbi:MAG: SDR family oxidoreductase [Caldilinea sp. CFX5]|nr:SDR family oxidoreductase [Caldilinea sp. CFX5]
MAQAEEIKHAGQPLAGQVTLVTGGGRGLGRAYALALAQAGMAVAVTARTTAEIAATAQQIEQNGGRALAIPADVTDAKAIAHLIATVERQLGPIDLLVNNAGIARAFALIAEVGEEEWWREVEVNLRGPFLCARGVLPSMIARQRGRIINVASRGGLIVFERASAYCVSKAALIRLSQFLAAETKEHGIVVFAIHPGTVRTPMNEEMRTSELVRQRAPLIQQNRQKLHEEESYEPIEQSVDLVLLLASGQADALSGRFLSIEDDLNELVRRSAEIERDDLYTLQLHKLATNQEPL